MRHAQPRDCGSQQKASAGLQCVVSHGSARPNLKGGVAVTETHARGSAFLAAQSVRPAGCLDQDDHGLPVPSAVHRQGKTASARWRTIKSPSVKAIRISLSRRARSTEGDFPADSACCSAKGMTLLRTLFRFNADFLKFGSPGAGALMRKELPMLILASSRVRMGVFRRSVGGRLSQWCCRRRPPGSLVRANGSALDTDGWMP